MKEGKEGKEGWGGKGGMGRRKRNWKGGQKHWCEEKGGWVRCMPCGLHGKQ